MNNGSVAGLADELAGLVPGQTLARLLYVPIEQYTDALADEARKRLSARVSVLPGEFAVRSLAPQVINNHVARCMLVTRL